MEAIRPNPTLLQDLINEILVRVPVKSLLRFELVSKTWLSLIKDPAFVKSQLLHTNTVETDQALIMNRVKCYGVYKISLLHVDSRKILTDLMFPHYAFPKIVGSTNGIVCVAVYSTLTIRIYLWNPATRKSKLIPSYSICHELHHEALGFGYDPITHDFKIVIAVPRPSAEVYSAKKNVWRKLPDPNETAFYRNFHVCVKGFLCSIGHYGMVTFDMNKEVLNCAIKLPAHPCGNARIIEFNNSIAFIELLYELNDDDDDDSRLCEKISMWSLDDDACLSGGGVEPSWTIMFSIDFVKPDPYLCFGYFSNGDLLLLIETDVYQWISYNSDNKEAKILPLSVDMADHVYHRDFYEYRESLVSLAGFK